MYQIIKTLGDIDWYKVTMGQAVWNHYPNIIMGYRFINRGNLNLPPGFDIALREQIDTLKNVCFTSAELAYIKSLAGHYIKPNYLEWLANFRLNPDQVNIRFNGGVLEVTATGPWYQSIFWETILMSIISELYYLLTNQPAEEGWQFRTEDKMRRLRTMRAIFSEFGTRRRRGRAEQREVLQIAIEIAGLISQQGVLAGTSNIALACEFGLPLIGSVGHEWTMAHAGMFGFTSANSIALKVWADEFRAYLGTALPDTFTSPVFLRDFDPLYGILYNSLRHDSGDPDKFTDQVLAYWKDKKINPNGKYLMYTDGLDIPRIGKILDYTQARGVEARFGIGTHLTNDMGPAPVNIVVKPQYLLLPDGRRRELIKISDTAGKESGDPKTIAAAKFELGIP